MSILDLFRRRVDKTKAPWEITEEGTLIKIILRRPKFSCDEVISLIRQVTKLHGQRMMEVHNKECPHRLSSVDTPKAWIARDYEP